MYTLGKYTVNGFIFEKVESLETPLQTSQFSEDSSAQLLISQKARGVTNGDLPTRFDSNAVNPSSRHVSHHVSNEFPKNTETIIDSFLTENEPALQGKHKLTQMNCFQRIAHSLREGSSLGTVVTLVMTAAVGPGVLALPYAVNASGWVLSLILMVSCAILCNFSLQLMTKVGKMTGKHTYSSIAECLFKGKKMSRIVQITFFLNNWGAAAADLILINDLITQCLRNLSISSIPSFLTDPQSNFWSIFLGVFVGFPLCLKKNFSELRFVLFTGFMLTVYMIIIIFKNCMSGGFGTEISNADAFKPMGIFTTLPLIFFSFACHPVVLDGYRELEIPNERKYRKVLIKTMSILLVFYACIGIFGYLTFADAPYKLATGNILLAYRPGDVAIDLATLFFSLTMTVSLPLGMKPVKAVLVEIVHPKGKPESALKHTLLTAIVVGSVILCTVVVSNMTLITGFLGSSFNALIVFNLPCIFYLKVIYSKGKKKDWRFYAAHVLNVSLFIFSIFSIYYLVDDTIKGTASVGG